MKKRYILLSWICVCAVFIIANHNAAQGVNGLPTKVPGPRAENLQPAGKLKVDVDFAKIPLYFIANRGQVNAKARFYARASRYTLWLTQEGLVFDEIKKQDSTFTNDRSPMTDYHSPIYHFTNLPLTNHQLSMTAHHSTNLPLTKLARDVSRLIFIGANKNPGMKAVRPAALKVNYFIGNDRAKWRCAVPTALAVRYENLYKNIDLEVYGVEKQIEYDWVVRPGGDPAAIEFEYKGTKGTRIDEEGNLAIETRFGELVHKKPVSYQLIDSKKQPVAAGFKKTGPDRYGFSIGSYDKSHHLIIDPVVLAYSTYLGGSGGEEGFGIDADDSGNVYVTGWTGCSDFPIKNEFMTDPSTGNSEVFVSKIDTTKSGTASLIYSTYLGGYSGSETGFGIFADDMGNAYVCGNTGSSDFPIKNQYMTYSGYDDAFVTKLDTTKSGSASLVYSTYLGGSLDDHCSCIAVDKSGNVYVTGWTYSTDFPTKNQYMSDPGDNKSDSFVAKLDTTQSGTSGLVYSTYLGSSGYDGGVGIYADDMGVVYVCGSAGGADFPIKNAYMVDPGDDNYDAFVTKLDTTQSGAACLLYSTYLAGSNNDCSREIVVDSSGYAYLIGMTGSPDFPTKNEYMTDPGDNAYDVFLCKIDASQSGADSLLLSTYFGGSGGDYGVDIGMDSSANVYFTGCTVSSDLPLKAQYMDYPGPGFNFYVAKMDINKSGDDILVYSTYLGGLEEDHCNSIAVDKNGSAYVTGVTYSVDYPTKNAYMNAPLFETFRSVFVTKLSLVEGVLVTAPNGGENWRLGSPQNITWLTADVSNLLKITLWKDGTQLGVIADNIDPALETYSWTAGNYSGGTVAPGAGYAVKIKETGTTAADASNASFTLSALTVVSPNGGENWKLGSSQNITWNAVGVSGLLKITLWKDGTQQGVIADNVAAAAGSYSWTAGNYAGGTAAPGSVYTIKIKEAGAALTDTSDAPFTFSPGITITAPNGGENWTIGASRAVTWKSGGLSNPVKITLLKDGAPVGTIAANVNPAVGSFAWTVGHYIGGSAAAGTGYKIKIKEIGASVADTSDAPFQLSQ